MNKVTGETRHVWIFKQNGVTCKAILHRNIFIVRVISTGEIVVKINFLTTNAQAKLIKNLDNKKFDLKWIDGVNGK